MPAKKLPPNLKEPLLQCMEVSGSSVEGAQYFADQFQKLLIATKSSNTFADLMQNVKEFVQYTHYKLGGADEAWVGRIREGSEYQRIQAEIGLKATQNLTDLNISAPVTFDFAVSENSEFRRGYFSEEQYLDETTSKPFDELFHSYLVDNNMKIQDGILYESDSLTGERKRDTSGTPIKVDSEMARNLIMDAEKGYARYVENAMSKKGITIPISCQELDFPASEKGTTVEPQVEEMSPIRSGR